MFSLKFKDKDSMLYIPINNIAGIIHRDKSLLITFNRYLLLNEQDKDVNGNNKCQLYCIMPSSPDNILEASKLQKYVPMIEQKTEGDDWK